MEEILNADNILSGDEIDHLFDDTGEETPIEKNTVSSTTTEEKEEVEEVDPETLFTPESVSSGTQEKEQDPDSEQETGSSPSTDFYSSIAAACKEDGIFSDLEDDIINNIKDADAFRAAMSKQVEAMLDEKQRLISEALDYGIEPDEIRKYQGALDYLNSVTDEALKDESDKGESLRRQLIYNDYLNKGFSEERAKRFTQRAFDQGTDIEDALDARNSNKEYYTSRYKELLEEAKTQAQEEEREAQQKAESVKKAILETEEPFEGIKLDKTMRQKVFETISKPIAKDKYGNSLTALQKAQQEDEQGFITKLGYIFTLTNGFKDLDGLVKSKVRSETKKGLRKLENVLRTSTPSGEPRFTSGSTGDDYTESGNIVLDI